MWPVAVKFSMLPDDGFSAEDLIAAAREAFDQDTYTLTGWGGSKTLTVATRQDCSDLLTAIEATLLQVGRNLVDRGGESRRWPVDIPGPVERRFGFEFLQVLVKP